MGLFPLFRFAMGAIQQTGQIYRYLWKAGPGLFKAVSISLPGDIQWS
jgi:hypothetical protein